LETIDDPDVLLAASTRSQEGDSDAIVGTHDTAGACGGERQGGRARGAGLQEIAAMDIRAWHESLPPGQVVILFDESGASDKVRTFHTPDPSYCARPPDTPCTWALLRRRAG